MHTWYLNFCILLLNLDNSYTYSTIDPDDVHLNLDQLLEKYGYPFESHQVRTKDGYILEMHRISNSGKKLQKSTSNKQVVLLQHGLESSSPCFVATGVNDSIGTLLADINYDVWLGNSRGNKFSRNHVDLDPDEAAFWNYSWHEIGVYDLTAMIDYILDYTKQKKLFYIGHSQGTTVFYVMASERPEYNDKILAMISLAPIAFMSHVPNPLFKFLAKFDGHVEVLSNVLGMHEWFPSNRLMSEMGDILCKGKAITFAICANSIFLVVGYSPDQLNPEIIPVIMNHYPAGSSSKQVFHYTQLINAENKFRQYNYGKDENLIKYNETEPPSYNLSKITTPIYLFYSKNDLLAAEEDVFTLKNSLPNVQDIYLVPEKNFNHIDFLYGKNAKELVFNKVIKILKKYRNQDQYK